MATASVVEEEVVSPEGRSVVLKRDSLGISSAFFCIATAAAPMTALLFNVPVIVSGAGWAAPAAFILALLMLLVFTVGYVEMTRQFTSAGGFYSFVSHGFGQTLGLGTAAVITFSYTILTASIVGIFAYFAKTPISDWTGASIPLSVLLLGAVAVCLLFAYFDIQITARVLGVFFVALAPLLGGGLTLFSAWLLFHNRSALSGAGHAQFIRYGFWLIPITFVLGVGAALWFRARDTARYEAVGRFVHEEA